MANIKTGLDFFPFDVDFFSDDKVEFVSARFGLKGENIIIRLLCRIYREGYYCQFGEDEALLFAKRVGDSCQHLFVNDVVQELVKRGFFDKSIFDRFKILTSKGIQKRFLEAASRRKRVQIHSHLLLVNTENFDNVDIIGENVDIISENVDTLTQRKEVKEVKKEKLSNESSKKFTPPSLEQMKKYFLDNGYTMDSAEKAYQYYSAGQWKDSKGNQVRNWKQKCIAVWFKPEHQIQKLTQMTIPR